MPSGEIHKCPGEGYWYLAKDIEHAMELCAYKVACSHQHRIFLIHNLEQVSDRIPPIPLLYKPIIPNSIRRTGYQGYAE